jgi:hypothetical protein
MTVGYVESVCTVPSGTTLTATSNSGGPTSVPITAGSYYIIELCAHVQAQLIATRPVTAGTWTVTLSTVTGLVTIAVTAGTFSITWTTAELGTILGHTTITTQTSVTGSTACRGIFVPDRPLNIEDDPRAAPMLTDLRETESPTGFGLAVVGNAKYVHNNLRWSRVSRERYLDTDSGVTPSWERFVKNTQLGQGHSWFTPRSKVKISDHTGALVGSEAGVTKWWFRGVNRVTAKKHDEAWTGAWLIEVPALVSDGT